MGNREIIGVIGGAGVAAGAELVRRLEQKVTSLGAYRDAHHPEVILWQATDVPSRSMFLEGRGPSFIPGYVEIGRKLKACGVTRIAMSCNTAHYAIDQIERAVGIPVINLIRESVLAVERVKSKNCTVGVLCSDGTRRVELFDSYFRTLTPNVQVIYPDEFFQKKVTKGICNVKNLLRNSCAVEENPNGLFVQVVRHLESQGADVILEGCTEIPLAVNASDFITSIGVDSLNVLVDAIFKCWMKQCDPDGGNPIFGGELV